MTTVIAIEFFGVNPELNKPMAAVSDNVLFPYAIRRHATLG